MFFNRFMSFSGGLFGKLDGAITEYKSDRDILKLSETVNSFAFENKGNPSVGDMLINTGRRLIDQGEYDAGIAFMEAVYENFTWVCNTTTLHLRLAESEFKKGNVEKGKEYLRIMCQKVSNYEESIGFNGLCDVWNEYKHYVGGEVAKSVRINEPEPILPESCSEAICNILELSGEDLLSELSTHLSELSADGERLDLLSPQEKNVYYVDEFIENINSDGLDHYLYYYGTNFVYLRSALDAIGCDKAIDLTDKIMRKLPRRAIPKSEERWQDVLDKLEEKGKGFEDLEDYYYESVEHSLIYAVSDYVKANKDCFK